jgi:hypothetical protein
MNINNEEQYEQFEELAKQQERSRLIKSKKDDYQHVIEVSEQQIKHYKERRFGRTEQIEEADRYIKQYEQLRNEAELKLLKLILDQ